MQIELEAKTVEGLLNYLATRPWGEVNGLLVPLLQQFEAQKSKPSAEQPQLSVVPVTAAE